MADATGLRERFILGCRDAVERAAEQMVDNARAKVVVNTGFLRDSIQDPVLVDDNDLRIAYKMEATADYAQYVEFDTPEHTIDAVNAPLLVFFWADGPHGPGIYKFRSVHHPGTTAQPFFFPTEEEWREALQFQLQVEPLFSLH